MACDWLVLFSRVYDFCESNDYVNLQNYWAITILGNSSYTFIIFSTLPPTECCQLQATVKHKQLIGGDQILGVTSVSLDSILKSLDVIMKTCVYTINLNRSLYHDERGRAFLTMLALRNSDEIAQDFVMLRTCRRLETD